jgi:hypothetical protein
VAVHAAFTPCAHDAGALQAEHGSLPVAALKVNSAVHAPGAALHSMSEVAVHAAFTPDAHDAGALQAEHGSLPVAVLKVDPAAHAPGAGFVPDIVPRKVVANA